MKTKVCFKCNKRKRLSSYYRHRAMGDGHLGKCKTCTKTDVLQHRKDNIVRIRAYDRKRGKYPHRIKDNARRNKERNLRHPIRYAAKTIFNNAIKYGKIIKPKKCSKCGEDGLIHGHHPNYNYPLTVIWVCVVCHSAIHNGNFNQ